MFGYVKPLKGELLVRHYQLYQGLYCGLCDTIRSQVSPALALALNYDFVFLALVRALCEDQQFQMEKKRCGVHPWKKREHVIPCPSLEFSARAALLLTCENLSDDLHDPDTGFWKKLCLRPYYALLCRDRKKLLQREPALKSLQEAILRSLRQMEVLESEGCDELDRFCVLFGELMSELFSFGLEGEERLLCREIGDYVGRLVYTVDACDDLEKDEKHRAFNPLLVRYQSAERARDAFMELDMVMSIYASRIDAALGLFSCQKDYKQIAHNVASRGIGALLRSVLDPNRSKTKQKKTSTKGAAKHSRSDQ